MAVHFWRIRKDGGLAKPEDADEAGCNQILMKILSGFYRSTEQNLSIWRQLSKVKLRQVGKVLKILVPSMPHLFYAELAALMLTVLICFALAFISDAPLKELANPLVPENPAKAPWYFFGLQEIVSFSAFTGGIGIPMLCISRFGIDSVSWTEKQMEQANGLAVRAVGNWSNGQLLLDLLRQFWSKHLQFVSAGCVNGFPMFHNSSSRSSIRERF